jgi:hypothetical protein
VANPVAVAATDASSTAAGTTLAGAGAHEGGAADGGRERIRLQSVPASLITLRHERARREREPLMAAAEVSERAGSRLAGMLPPVNGGARVGGDRRMTLARRLLRVGRSAVLATAGFATAIGRMGSGAWAYLGESQPVLRLEQ